jgi:hypothetical protein
MLRLSIKWSGPYELEHVVKTFTDGGVAPDYDGEDYGLYQIYGRHILGDRNALLYIGSAADQTFSARFAQHKRWLINEWRVHVYLGRIYSPRRHKLADAWASWSEDILLAERIMVYKYSPHYNSASITNRPLLSNLKRVELVHVGDRGRLRRRDIAPDDWD